MKKNLLVLYRYSIKLNLICSELQMVYPCSVHPMCMCPLMPGPKSLIVLAVTEKPCHAMDLFAGVFHAA